MKNELTTQTAETGIDLFDSGRFEALCRVSDKFAHSPLIPQTQKGIDWLMKNFRQPEKSLSDSLRGAKTQAKKAQKRFTQLAN